MRLSRYEYKKMTKILTIFTIIIISLGLCGCNSVSQTPSNPLFPINLEVTQLSSPNMISLYATITNKSGKTVEYRYRYGDGEDVHFEGGLWLQISDSPSFEDIFEPPLTCTNYINSVPPDLRILLIDRRSEKWKLDLRDYGRAPVLYFQVLWDMEGSSSKIIKWERTHNE